MHSDRLKINYKISSSEIKKFGKTSQIMEEHFLMGLSRRSTGKNDIYVCSHAHKWMCAHMFLFT
jgi:hypothetical protein